MIATRQAYPFMPRPIPAFKTHAGAPLADTETVRLSGIERENLRLARNWRNEQQHVGRLQAACVLLVALSFLLTFALWRTAHAARPNFSAKEVLQPIAGST